MYTVSCLVTSIILLIALVICVYALTLQAKDNPRAKTILTAGFVTALAGIFLGAVIFGFGSI
jgi:nitric oxide reductase large subunit